MAEGLGGRADLPYARPRARRRAVEPLVPAGNAPVPVGDAAHGARPELLDGRRAHALPPPERLERAAPDGLGLLRPPRGERRDPRGRPSARDRRAQHPRHPPPDEADRLGDRLAAGGRRARARLLPVDAVAVHPLLRARARLPQGGAGELVPVRPDGRRQRVRDRRALRALRDAGRAAQPRAVVLQDHRVRRRAAALRPARGRLVARAHDHDPAQLDRQERGRRDPLPRRGARHRHPRLHDAARHALRRHVLRARARASAGRADRERGGRRVRQADGAEEDRGARGGRGQDRRVHRPPRDQPGERRAASRSGSPTTC